MKIFVCSHCGCEMSSTYLMTQQNFAIYTGNMKDRRMNFTCRSCKRKVHFEWEDLKHFSVPKHD